MKVIAGLGNPGEKYARTRHNVGFMVVEALGATLSSRQPDGQGFHFQFSKKFNADIMDVDDVMLMKPQTFMNTSGESVQKVMSYYQVPLADLWVIHDDLDIRVGEYKIKQGVGPKIHNGVNSIRHILGNDQFWHMRIGIDNRTHPVPGEQYVLSAFTDEERVVINDVIVKVTYEFVSRYL